MSNEHGERVVAAARAFLSEANREEALASRTRRNAIAMAVNAGMSQRLIARELGLTQPTVSYLLNHSATRDALDQPIRWMTARNTAKLVRETLDDGDESLAFRLLLQGCDHLRALHHPDDVAEWAVEPARIPDVRFDALFRALALHLLGRHPAGAPSWAPPLRLADPWVVARPSQVKRAVEQAPEYLKAVNVYLTPESLVNA